MSNANASTNYFRSSTAILRKLAQAGDANATAELARRKERRATKAAKGELGFVQALLSGEVSRPKAKAKPKVAQTTDEKIDAIGSILGVNHLGDAKVRKTLARLIAALA